MRRDIQRLELLFLYVTTHPDKRCVVKERRFDFSSQFKVQSMIVGKFRQQGLRQMLLVYP